MMRVNQRIERLERTFGVSDHFKPFVHRISFVEADGTVTGTMVMSDDPNLRQEYRDVVKEEERTLPSETR
jgi:hypothetical protein